MILKTDSGKIHFSAEQRPCGSNYHRMWYRVGVQTFPFRTKKNNLNTMNISKIQ